jgi:hypothetical protein
VTNEEDAADARRAALVHAYDAGVAADDVDAMSSAALALAGLQVFGTVPGRLPAFLHHAYERSSGRRRVELAIAIARTWSYGGDPGRAQPFVDEALAAPEVAADQALLAAALDAQLLTAWGPDDFVDRLALTARLEDVVAHLSDVELRMSAHLWRLTTALECCDVAVVRRQLRSLDALAADTGSARVRFFAASRRAMHALLVGDLDLADRAHDQAVAAGTEAGEADTFALDNALAAAIARQRGDLAELGRLAPIFEQFGEREGVIAVAAEAAQNWAYAGDAVRARRLLQQIAGADFDGIPRGVDWLHTVVRLTEVAAMLDERALAAAALAQLRPYAGRGVVDGGAVVFVGVVDESLAAASDALGETDEAGRWRVSAADLYRRLGASWFLRRCETVSPADPGVEVFRPTGGGSWELGRAGRTTLLRELRGFHYLRLLLQRPHVDVPARVLSDAAAGHPGVAALQGGLGPALDRQAVAAYRRRLAELDEDIDAAREANDGERAARLDAERDVLLAELSSSTGLAGRARSHGSTDERARVAVRKAVAAAIDRLRSADPSLARLLDDTISTGSSCRYEPDPDRPVTWQLD